MISSYSIHCARLTLRNDAMIGLDPTRDPLIDTDGCFFVVILSTACSWYAGLKVYAGILAYCGTDPKHIPDGGMDGVDYAGYNFALGGTLHGELTPTSFLLTFHCMCDPFI